jgi:hypothetical protein
VWNLLRWVFILGVLCPAAFLAVTGVFGTGTV